MELRAFDSTDLAPNARARLKRAIEAILFAADQPVEAERMAHVFHEVTGSSDFGTTDVEAAVEELNTEYAMAGRVFRIRRWAGGYRLSTDEDAAAFIQTFFQENRSKRLSQSLLETLAIVAYRQPITRPEIDFIRGVDSGYAIRKLMEMQFADVVGRSDAVGRPLLYGTTRHFLEQFGLDTLDDLPTLREIEEILADPAFNRERAELLSLQERDQALEQVSGQQPDDTQQETE